MTARKGATAAPRRSGRRGARARFRSLGAALMALALLVAPPLVLVQGVGNPVAELPRSLSEVQQWWDQRYLPVGAVMGVLTLVLWLLWFQYVWALLWELFVAGPRSARGRVGRPAPGVPRFTRSLVTSLVSGVMSAGLVASTAGPALAPLVSAMVPSANPVASLVAGAMGMAAPETPAAAPVAPVAGQPRLYQVQADDSLWRLAGQDDAMLKRILELNEDQIRTPVDLRPGMVLRLPDSLDAPVRAPVPGPAPAVSAGGGGAQEHVVERGDNLWELTEAQLVATGTPDPTNAQIVDQLGVVIDANTPPIVDPDLIYPGQVVVLPPSGGGAAPAPSALAPSLPPTTGAADRSPEADGSSARAGADGVVAAQAVAEAGGGAGAGAVLDRIELVPVAPVTPATASGPTTADPVALGRVEVMAVAAAAMIGLAGQTRRRRRAAYGFAPPGPGADGSSFLDQLAAAADPGLTLWAAAQLHPLAQVAARIVTVGLSSTDGLEVVWNAEPELTIGGWTAVEPRRWHRPYDGPDADGGARQPPVALPGLVTLGERRDDSNVPGPQILADLGTIGSLSVAGPPERVASTVRAMVYELGLGEHLSNAFVTTVGFTVGDAGQLDRVARRTEDEALQLARDAADRHRRLDHRLGPRELEVLVVRTEHTNLNPFLDLAGRRAGVALLVAGDLRSSRIGARLELSEDGTAHFRPAGGGDVDGPLVAAALTRPQEQELTALLASSSSASPIGGDAAPATPEEARARIRARGAARWAGPGPGAGEILVHLLGPVRCPDAPELQAHALSLVAYLAVQPGRRATAAQVAAALWGDRPVSPLQIDRVIDAARAALGPERLPATGPAGELGLVGVGTDLEILHGLLDAPAGTVSPGARAAALDLIDGPPLGGVALRWAGATDLADYAADLVEAVVLDTVETAQRAGDADLANRAVHQGLAALPTSERIYRAWMRLAAADGDPALIESIWRSLRSALAADGGALAADGGALAADGGAEDSVQPTSETRAVYEGLLRSVVRRHEPVGG